ncbi:MAG: Deoxyguanosinetriphosphate triphosphohydrolase-like protein [Candidatus Anoxychlamydiales bacterium]|nr:Deoxyguanosinetriphosphate triphosphohydrolase-like protein [Candidatus Anoxychlamydiales bacterium]
MFKDSYKKKKIYDPIHGFIKYDEIEKNLIDSTAFQRLHYIRQLGVSYLVYPGATHTRFEHSLGVMELASKIFKRLHTSIRADVFDLVPRRGSEDYRYYKKILRLSALCHDLGHLPFSHVAEKKILPKYGHERWTYNIIQSPILDKIWQKLSKKIGFENRNIKEDIIKLSLGEKSLERLKIKTKFTSFEKMLSQIITGDFFGADRIDYLLRDSKYTGVSYGLFDYLQLIEMLRILPSKNKELVIGIDENGLESLEALLLARHFMHKRVYQHPSVKAFNFHLTMFMHEIFKNGFKDVDSFLDESDPTVINRLNQIVKNKNDPLYFDASKIIFRKKHFKAIPVEYDITKKDIDNFKEKNNIPGNKIYFDLLEKKEKKSFNFLISKKNFDMIEISKYSSLINSIPPTEKNWVYISAEYEVLFLTTFKK